MMDSRRLGRVLRILRSIAGMKLEDLGKALGYSAAYLSLLEHGKRVPNLEVIDRAAKFYGLPMAYIFLLASVEAEQDKIMHLGKDDFWMEVNRLMMIAEGKIL